MTDKLSELLRRMRLTAEAIGSDVVPTKALEEMAAALGTAGGAYRPSRSSDDW